MATKIDHALLEVDIEQALALRQLINDGNNDANKLNFLCPNCNKPIRPHSASGHGSKSNSPAHFEHLTGKTECELTHKSKEHA